MKEPKKLASYSALLKQNRGFWKNPFTVVLSTLVIFFLAQLLGAFMVAPILGYLSSQNMKLLVYIAANTFALFGLIALAMSIIGFKWQSLGLKRASLKNLLLVIPAFVLYFSVSIAFSALAMRFIPGFDIEQAQDIAFSRGGLSADTIAAFLSLVVLTPLFEEIIFRGVLFKGLRRRLPFLPSAIITSIVFAVAHGQWNVAIDTFALSLVLCYMVEKSGSIVPAILLHALKNALAFTLLFIINV